MTSYVIIDLTPIKPELISIYSEKAKKTVSEYNGLFIAMGETEVLHGEALHPIKIIIEFPSKKHAHDWYESESYQKLISIRDQSMHSQFHII
jgi:uncharacterized protein (DUF1330 family)